MYRRAAQRAYTQLGRQTLSSPTILSRPSMHSVSAPVSPASPPCASATMRVLCVARPLATGPNSKDAAPAPAPAAKQTDPHAAKRRFADDLNEYNERVSSGHTAAFDADVIPKLDASPFPRIKTTSLSTKRIVIADKARKKPVTLVMVAFRSFADDQLQSWKNVFMAQMPADAAQYYDVTINESFAAQALSGFIQRLQRGRTDPALHDYHVAFNSRAREPLEALLPSQNRIFGYVLLLDRDARVRFRASGMASSDGHDAMLSAARHVLVEDAEKAAK